jgi:site-specific DNA-adenine methylase
MQNHFRIPYQGSKQAIVHKIYDAINRDLGNTNDLFVTTNINTIYDLFCGGGSIGYYFHQKGWNVHMNDIHKPLIELHQVLNMDNSLLTNDLLYKWISRENFNELKTRQDWYGELIKICWSFGNNKQSYMFVSQIENYKKH